MANYTYKETTTKNLKIKGIYSASDNTITVTDKEGNETIHVIDDLLMDFDGREMNFAVTDKEEIDLLELD